jgi:hypothetical protein
MKVLLPDLECTKVQVKTLKKDEDIERGEEK